MIESTVSRIARFAGFRMLIGPTILSVKPSRRTRRARVPVRSYLDVGGVLAGGAHALRYVDEPPGTSPPAGTARRLGDWSAGYGAAATDPATATDLLSGNVRDDEPTQTRYVPAGVCQPSAADQIRSADGGMASVTTC
jgi:hypothetical protein